MKSAKTILMLLLIYIGNLSANKNEKTVSITIPEIKIEDPKIDSLINFLIADNQEELIKGCYLLIYEERRDTENYIEIEFYRKKKFTLRSKYEYPFLGFTEYNNQQIFIFGKKNLDNIRFIDRKKTFIFKYRKEGKNYPPSMYYPPIYKYIYNEKGIKQIKEDKI